MKCVRVVPLESIAEIPFQKKQQAEPQSHSSWYTQMSVDQCRLLPKLEKFKATVELQSGYKMKKIRSDRGENILPMNSTSFVKTWEWKGS
ncbi:unnamed protein product [Prunus armeniaca]